MIFKVLAYDGSDKLVAEYLYETEDSAMTFAKGMQEKGYTVTVQKIFHHD